MWTKENLQQTIQSRMSDYKLIIVSNRQPYQHVLKARQLVTQREAGGLVTALDPVMQAVERGIWIASAGSEYDLLAVDQNNKVTINIDDSSYILKRLFLSKPDRHGYYYGYSNSGVWPLSHIAYTRPFFKESDWQSYKKVNQKFADAILEEVGSDKAFVWIHDFHLALVAKYLKEANRPNIITSIFWHIPWPNPEVFQICPQKNEILEGLLSCDLLGFQIRYHCDNFLAAVDRELEARIDREKNSVIFQNKETFVRPFPISVDFESISEQTNSERFEARGHELREEFGIGENHLIVGVDRIDYTKGIPERLRAFDRFLEKYPEYHKRVVFFQLGQISRIHIPRYKELNDEINALVEEINWKHSEGTWKPVVFTRDYMSYDDILAMYRAANACVVSSLHDGMNLVAKEFIASRPDLKGVLLLSQFTGAARELTDSLIINPYDPETFADSMAQALNMPIEEQEKRMKRMREIVHENNIYRWAGKVLSQLLKFEFQEYSVV